MTNVIKKISIPIILMSVMILCLSIPVKASETIISDEIPTKMQPDTIINFIDDNAYKIIKGGQSSQENIIELPEEINAKLDAAKKDGTYYTAYHGDMPNPVKGLKVYYADDGYILRLEYPDGVKNPLMQEVISPNESIVQLETRGGPGPNDTLLYVWGDHDNQIWRIGNSSTARYGYGRATNFTDKIGERDNVLKKGDAATSQAYDNCAYGTALTVIAPKKSGGTGTKTLYKRDVGGMPDAVLDIWKTGVEYWGYTWKSSLSINDVQYTHN